MFEKGAYADGLTEAGHVAEVPEADFPRKQLFWTAGDLD